MINYQLNCIHNYFFVYTAFFSISMGKTPFFDNELQSLVNMITENQANTSVYAKDHHEESDHDDSCLDARLLAASDLTFTSVDDSFLANLSTSAATVQTDEADWEQVNISKIQ
jgi:uncharacterized protein YktB (UPF0637 family)